MRSCPNCGANAPAASEFCPSCLGALDRSSASGEPPYVPPPPPTPPENEKPKPAHELMTFNVHVVDGASLLAVALGELALGVAFGSPAFPAELRWVYGGLVAVAGAGALVLLTGTLLLRRRHFAVEDDKLRAKAERVSIAGASAGMSGRDHSVSDRHLLIAASVMFSIGAAVGSAVVVRP